VTVKVNGVPAVMPVPATLQTFSFPTVEVFVKLASVVAPVETVAVTAAPMRSRSAHAPRGVHAIALTLVFVAGVSTILMDVLPLPGPPSFPSLNAVSVVMRALISAFERGVESTIALPLTAI